MTPMRTLGNMQGGTGKLITPSYSQLDAVYNIAYGTDSTFRPNISEPGALEQWLLADGRTPFQNEFLTEVTLAQWRTIALAQGGMSGSFKWYKAMMRGYNTADEEGECMCEIVFLPFLYIARLLYKWLCPS